LAGLHDKKSALIEPDASAFGDHSCIASIDVRRSQHFSFFVARTIVSDEEVWKSIKNSYNNR